MTWLTLGDGDFTFSLDLARFLVTNHQSQCHCLIATGMDSAESLQLKYRDSSFVLRELTQVGLSSLTLRVQICHGVNAIVWNNHSDNDNSSNHYAPCGSITNTTTTTTLSKADVVLFNHPHLGIEDAALHSRFLCHLFDSVEQSWLRESGIFLLTLVRGQYERWRCLEAACRHRMKLLDRYIFVPEPAGISDPCYEHRRHQSGKSFASRTSGSETFVFVRTSDALAEQTILQQVRNLPWFQKQSKQWTHGDVERMKIKKMMDNLAKRYNFLCPHCNKTFREGRSLKNHIQSKHKDSAPLGTKRDLASIESTDANEGEIMSKAALVCPHCSEESRFFQDHMALKDHIRAKHNALHTTIRPDWSENVSASRSHIAAANFEPVGTCNICRQSFWTKAEKENHSNSFIPSLTTESFQCNFCKKHFAQKRAMLQHENFCTARPS